VVQTTDKTTLNGGTRPTYYAVADHADGSLRIMYWWFYGYQYPCNVSPIRESGAHMGDWERIMVTTTPDRTEVESVTYWQHGGWYTRTPGPLVAGRPLVYVGKDNHGSYHYRNEMQVFAHSCPYWDDIRSPNGPIPSSPPPSGASTDYWWTSTSPLLELSTADGLVTQEWMKADRIGEVWAPTGDTITQWSWGPTISWLELGRTRWTQETAVSTHPTGRMPDWSMAPCLGNEGMLGTPDGCSKSVAPLWRRG
jgi:hypothetical protein